MVLIEISFLFDFYTQPFNSSSHLSQTDRRRRRRRRPSRNNSCYAIFRLLFPASWPKRAVAIELRFLNKRLNEVVYSASGVRSQLQVSGMKPGTILGEKNSIANRNEGWLRCDKQEGLPIGWAVRNATSLIPQRLSSNNCYHLFPKRSFITVHRLAWAR